MLARHWPRRIFLIDGLGALATAAGAGLVLPWFVDVHGIPVSVLYVLAGVGCVFCAYSLSRYFAQRLRRWMLVAIILGNLGYCVLAAVLLATERALTPWGRAYLTVEIGLVLALVLAEIHLCRRADWST